MNMCYTKEKWEVIMKDTIKIDTEAMDEIIEYYDQVVAPRHPVDQYGPLYFCNKQYLTKLYEYVKQVQFATRNRGLK